MKANDSPKAQTNKTTYMRDEAFADLKQALKDALAFERGGRRGLKVTRIPRIPPAQSVSQDAAIRQTLTRLADVQ